MVSNTYTVEFIGEYMSLTTTVSATNGDEAVANAQTLIYEYYGWDLTQIKVIDVGWQVS